MVGLRKGTPSTLQSIQEGAAPEPRESGLPFAQAAKRSGCNRRPIWSLALAAVLLLAIKDLWRHAGVQRTNERLLCQGLHCLPDPHASALSSPKGSATVRGSGFVDEGLSTGGAANESAATGVAQDDSAGVSGGGRTADGHVAGRHDSDGGSQREVAADGGSERQVSLSESGEEVGSEKGAEPSDLYVSGPMLAGRSEKDKREAGGGGAIEEVEAKQFDASDESKEKTEEDKDRGFRDDPTAESVLPALSPNCDIYSGQWVRDESYPLYTKCMFKEVNYECHGNGRKDSEYEKYRWQPHGCRIPHFNGSDFLERVRGKRVVFIGDSLSRTTFQSLMCMLVGGLSDFDLSDIQGESQEPFNARSSKKKVRFLKYNASFAFYRSMWLAEPSKKVPPKASRDKNVKGIINVDRVHPVLTTYGREADVLILNSGHWFSQAPVNYYGTKYYWSKDGQVNLTMSSLDAYRWTMISVRKWLQHLTERHLAVVYWRGYEPVHFKHGDWNTGGHCETETRPLEDESKLPAWPPQETIAEEVLRRTRVRHLNVTHLTRFRHDGHVSHYWPAGAPQLKRNIQDCTHWCLPGVPDAWNELLYASLLRDGFTA